MPARHLFQIFLTCFLLISCPSYAKKYKYKLSICAFFQNEAAYLKEWIEYHRLLGVEHFWLYNNSSADDYLDVLEPYLHSGIIELFDWPSPRDEDWTPYQQKAYCDCLSKATDVTRWLAVIDIDEFIVPKTCDSLVKFLKPYKKYGGVMIHWQMFGTSGFWEIPEGCLLMECLCRKCPKEAPCNSNQKSIVQPHRCTAYLVHGAVYKPGYHVVKPFDGGTGNVPIKQIQINHYWLRNEKFFREVKVPRRERCEGKSWSEEKIQSTLDYFNREVDFSIQRFVPLLKERMYSSATVHTPSVSDREARDEAKIALRACSRI